MGYEGHMAMDFDQEIEKIDAELQKLGRQSEEIMAASRGRDLTASEKAESDRLFREFDRLEGKRDALAQMSAAKSTGRVTEHNAIRNNAPRIEHVARQGEVEGFESAGHFFSAVKNSCARGGTIDPRLIMNAPTTYSSEGVGADGGFLVPEQWSNEVWQQVAAESSLLSYCDQLTVPGNQYVAVVDPGAPWDTTNGVRAYWKGEGQQLTQSKIALKDHTLRLGKLTVLVGISEELAEDYAGLNKYLQQKTAAVIDAEVSRTIMNGTGAGEPLGILQSDALVSVAKESGQGADTLLAENLLKMYSRLPAGCKNPVWVAHPSIVPQLFQMALSVGTGGVAVYMPPHGLSGQPYGTLFGFPLVFSQAANELGSKGDLLLCDLSQYRIIRKASGLRTQVSIHVWFDFDLQAFRAVLRISGSPLWSAPITSRDGSLTMSPFICLDERG